MGVDNAARTRDLLNHNQLLYLLSYIHHSCVASNRWILYMTRRKSSTRVSHSMSRHAQRPLSDDASARGTNLIRRLAPRVGDGLAFHRDEFPDARFDGIVLSRVFGVAVSP